MILGGRHHPIFLNTASDPHLLSDRQEPTNSY